MCAFKSSENALAAKVKASKLHSLQAYGFIRILYGIAQQNTEYGKSDIIYGFCHGGVSATREIRMRVHEKYSWKNGRHDRTTEGVLDLCNGAVSEKTPQIF